MRVSATLNPLTTSTTVNAYLKTFLPLVGNGKGNEDQVDELLLEIQHYCYARHSIRQVFISRGMKIY